MLKIARVAAFIVSEPLRDDPTQIRVKNLTEQFFFLIKSITKSKTKEVF